MPKVLERKPHYEKVHGYAIVQAITGQSHIAIRSAMKRKGIERDLNGFAAYILTFLNKKQRV